nr:myb domain protein 62 [Tanacetum cinerariifolium]
MQSSDASMKNKGLDKIDYSHSGRRKRVLKRSGHQNSSTNHCSQPIDKAHSSLRLRDEDSLVRETAKTFSHNLIYLGGTTVMRKETSTLSKEHMGSTSNGTTVTRKETRALSATKKSRLNNRKLVFEVDDFARRIVREDSQTFITKGGCIVRESEKFDGTTWRKQQPLLKTNIISKCTENSSFNLNCQSMARAINSQLASHNKSRRWRLHTHYKNYPIKEQAIMNPPKGNEEYVGSDDDDDDDDDDGQGIKEYDRFDDDDNGDDAQGNEEYNGSNENEYKDDGLDDDGEEHEDAI